MILIVLASLAAAQNPAPGPACSQPEVQGFPFCNLSLTFAERASDLVSRLELAEIGPQLTARQAPAIARLGIPSFYWGVNNVHGVTNPVSGGVLCLAERCVTIWPSGPNLGATFNASLFRLVGQTSGIEMRALNNAQWNPVAGMDGLVSWGPTVNLARAAQWGRNQETSGEDPLLNGVFAREITRGLQEGVDPRYLLAASTLKHFAVYSLEDYHTPAGLHVTRENINNVVSQFDLADSYFPHFEMAIRPVSLGGGGAAGVMMAMNAVNGIPALANSQLINQVKEWAGPDGVYISTDGINMIDSMLQPEPAGHFFCPYHAAPCSRAEGIAAAVVAGSDICDGNEYQETLEAAVLNGNMTLGDAQQRLFNSFLIRMRLGLFDFHVPNQPYLQYGANDLNTDASRAANLLAAQESLVLLQNENVLPFKLGQAGSTLVIGFHGNSTLALVSNYVGQICPDKTGSCFPSIVESIAALGESVQFVQACSAASSCPPSGISAAVAAARAPGITRVLFTLGISQAEEAEQKDRFNISLPEDQQTLFAAVIDVLPAGVPVAVVLVHGGALAVPELKATPQVAILDAFYPGPAGGQAVASVLFGLFNPGGKLPYSVYDTTYQAVDFTDMNIGSIGRTYRYHDDQTSPGGAALWSFGFGLSYTSWSLALAGNTQVTLTPAAPTFTVVVTITNTGEVWAGDEVVQVYMTSNITDLAAPLPPFVPLRKLVWFQRVHVAAQGSVALNVTLSATDLLLTRSDGTRVPIDGKYGLAINRGPDTPFLSVLATLAGWP